jgi:CRISPR-associated endonuclease/helicase Cas3
MNAALNASDFSSFFRELYGDEYAPFPWQTALVDRLCATGSWPKQLRLPTGTGKTAAIDIAAFHLAYQLSNELKRTAPLRIIFAVDRRLIVDEAFERAQHIAKKLDEARSGTLLRVAESLRAMVDTNDSPLSVGRLRGGMPREGDWAQTPTQPTVVSTTVDQLGSRLLFRGYGVSPRMRPVHAGLLGEDALIFLDEVHLSEAFRQTLEAIASYRQAEVSSAPWLFVQLSATPRDTEEPFELSSKDYANEELARRLRASKPASLVLLKHTAPGSADHVERFVDEVIDRSCLGNNPDGRRCAVVVNRIQLARRAFDLLRQRLQTIDPEAAARAQLMIGRGRDIEKDEIRKIVVKECKSTPYSSADLDTSASPFFLVATQTVEAGADLDFDVLVTQAAPLDALRQRFGRLNRMGRSIRANAAVIAVDQEVATSAKPDSLYGDAAKKTWARLDELAGDSERDQVDFGIDALPPQDDEGDLCTRARNAPVLMPEHVLALSHTREAPSWSPEPALFLHGAPDGVADVNVVWRADIPLLPPSTTNDDTIRAVTDVLALVPPRPAEALSWPLGAIRRWLFRDRSVDAEDVEHTQPVADHIEASAERITAYRWIGTDEELKVVVTPNQVKPGDTIVLPASVGGCDKFGWAPRSRKPVRDIAYEATKLGQRTAPLRIHFDLLAQDLGEQRPSDLEAVWSRIKTVLLADTLDDAGRIRELADVPGLPRAWRDALEAIIDDQVGSRFVAAYQRNGEDDFGSGAVIVPKSRRRGVSATESDDASAQGHSRETLIEHSRAVRCLAEKFARKLIPDLASDVALAAFLHDVGKADLRFQQFLGGSRWVPPQRILAKSGIARTHAENLRIWSIVGLPRQWRHEALSVSIAMEHELLRTANDAELVLWLIGTHHGFGRPDFPHFDPDDDRETRRFGGFEGGPVDVPAKTTPARSDFSITVFEPDGPRRIDWPRMFLRLCRRYGVWGLARLEAIVRLADHRASEMGASSVMSLPGPLTAVND